MKPSKFHTREALDEHIGVAVPSDLKAKVFEVAGRRGIDASQLIRQALRAAVDEPRAA